MASQRFDTCQVVDGALLFSIAEFLVDFIPAM